MKQLLSIELITLGMLLSGCLNDSDVDSYSLVFPFEVGKSFNYEEIQCVDGIGEDTMHDIISVISKTNR